jgi:hypothetical protein
MSDTTRPLRQRRDEIDISKPPPSEWLSPMNWFSWLLAVAGMLVGSLILGQIEGDAHDWVLWSLPPLVIGALAVWVLWRPIFRRGVFTWMRLAVRPAKLMALGDAAGADFAFQKALARAHRFGPDDARRGVMLIALADFAKNQGRYDEALALYEESVAILGRHSRARPDYFVALNNYAIVFIPLRDYATAQEIMEKAIDLMFAAKKVRGSPFVTLPQQVVGIEFLIRLNLAFLFIEMDELAEAASQLREADTIFAEMPNRTSARFYDQYVAIRALHKFVSGRFADAESEIKRAKNPDWQACLRVRARLALVRQNYAEAERHLRKLFELERKKGTLHRPELREHRLNYAESLFGQGKFDEAFSALLECLAIVNDFKRPTDAAWRKTCEIWLQRARQHGKADVAASLEVEVQKAPTAPEQAIMILEKFRIHPLEAE